MLIETTLYLHKNILNKLDNGAAVSGRSRTHIIKLVVLTHLPHRNANPAKYLQQCNQNFLIHAQLRCIIKRNTRGGAPMMCSISTKLSDDDIAKINSLEDEIGSMLLAFSCHEVNAASISDDNLKKVQELEKNLGAYLVAV